MLLYLSFLSKRSAKKMQVKHKNFFILPFESSYPTADLINLILYSKSFQKEVFYEIKKIFLVYLLWINRVFHQFCFCSDTWRKNKIYEVFNGIQDRTYTTGERKICEGFSGIHERDYINNLILYSKSFRKEVLRNVEKLICFCASGSREGKISEVSYRICEWSYVKNLILYLKSF